MCWANVHDVFLQPTVLQLYGPHFHSMLNLLKPGPSQQYVDLTLSFENEQEEDVPGTFRKLEFILCSTLMRLVVSIITFL